jgi:hypothetical protein
MGIFKRNLNNSATAVAPGSTVPARPIITPGNTTIHNHGIPWPAIIAVSFVCAVIILPPVGWFILVFLFEKMGAANPEKETAFWLIIIPVLFLAGWLLKWVLLSFFDSWLDYKKEVERELTRRVEANLLQAQTTIDPGRYNEADYDFARVIISVMANAYSWLEKEEYKTFPGRWRPWSLSSSKKTADEIGVKISQDKANEVSKWLFDRGVITDPVSGQIAGAFPTLSSVKAMLDNEFGRPIHQVSPTLRDNRGFKHI